MEQRNLLITDGIVRSATNAVEIELAKDRWDMRNLPGVQFNHHQSKFYLTFTGLPALFRPSAKQYMRFLLMSAGRSHQACRCHLSYLQLFLIFYIERYPGLPHFQHLSVADIDAYLVDLKSKPNRLGKPVTARHICGCIDAIKAFLLYLQRVKSPLAPIESVDVIIWPEHIGQRPQFNPHYNLEEVKYIPLFVLQQLDDHIQDLCRPDPGCARSDEYRGSEGQTRIELGAIAPFTSGERPSDRTRAEQGRTGSR